MGPRDPSDYLSNLLDLARAAAWAPPNLPLFNPPAPAPTDAPMAASAPADGAPPWLQPPHDIQRVAGTRSPSLPDPASPADIAASPWTSNGSSAPGAPAAAGPYTGAVASNLYLASSAGGDTLDPARTQRVLARAKRAHDFVAWMSGSPSVRPDQSMPYAAPAADTPWPGTPTTGIDDAVDQPAPFNPPPYTGAAAPNPSLGSSAGGDALDPARTRRLLERAKRAHDFVEWMSGWANTHPARSMQYTAAAADALRPNTQTARIDDDSTAHDIEDLRLAHDGGPRWKPIRPAAYWQATHGIEAGPPWWSQPEPPAPTAWDELKPAATWMSDRLSDWSQPSDAWRWNGLPQRAGTQAWPGAQAQSNYWAAQHGIDAAPPDASWPPTATRTPDGLAGASGGADDAWSWSRLPERAGTQAWPGAQAQSNYWQATHGSDIGPASDWTPEAQARAQMVTNRLFGLNGVERYHFFPERWFIDPFRNADDRERMGHRGCAGGGHAARRAGDGRPTGAAARRGGLANHPCDKPAARAAAGRAEAACTNQRCANNRTRSAGAGSNRTQSAGRRATSSARGDA